MVRWARRALEIIVAIVGAVLGFYIIAGGLMIWLGYLPNGPVTPREFGPAVVALAVGVAVSVTNALKTFLDQPVQFWHLIIAGFMIVLAIKHIMEQAIENAVSQIQDTLFERTELLDAPDIP
jgi:flagellar biosynthesis protein FliQ